MKLKITSFLIASLLLLSLCACAKNEEKSEAEAIESTLINLGDTEKKYGSTFGNGEIIDIYVEMADEDWQDICNNATAEEYHSATITVNGTKLENVGFRTKGFSSLSSVANSESNRYGFKVKTDKYVDGQTLNGVDMFVLNGSFADPSYMREYFTYAAAAYLGAVTPFLTYTNLYMNGKLFGFYICIEAYDDSFVSRVSESDKNAVLYKADYETCTLLDSDDGSGFDVDVGTDDTYENIKKLTTVLNQTTQENKAELEAVLDVDSVLKAIAVNTVTGNYDSYNGSKAHNYYLLYSGEKFTYIGWDYNMSIGAYSEDNGSSVSVDISSPVYNVDISERPLIQKLLAIPEYYSRYIDYINKLTSYFSDFESLVSQLDKKICLYIENDPSAFYTYDEYKANIASTGTDLTQQQGGFGKGQFDKGSQPTAPENGSQPTEPENGEAETPSTPDSQTQPMVPDGQTMPSMPNGQTPPSMPNGQTEPDGQTRPTLPDGQTAPDGQTMPTLPDGQTMPENFDKKGFGSMINASAVSIIDYITQRLTNIASQLSE